MSKKKSHFRGIELNSNLLRNEAISELLGVWCRLQVHEFFLIIIIQGLEWISPTQFHCQKTLTSLYWNCYQSLAKWIIKAPPSPFFAKMLRIQASNYFYTKFTRCFLQLKLSQSIFLHFYRLCKHCSNVCLRLRESSRRQDSQRNVSFYSHYVDTYILCVRILCTRNSASFNVISLQFFHICKMRF